MSLLATDPPYNVKVEPRSNNTIAAGLSSFRPSTTHHQALDLARHPEKANATHKELRAKDRPLTNDFVSDEALASLLAAWLSSAYRVMKPGAAFYVWAGDVRIPRRSDHPFHGDPISHSTGFRSPRLRPSQR